MILKWEKRRGAPDTLADGPDELRASVWSAGSLLPLSNAPPRPKPQQAARSRDIRNTQATVHKAAKATRPLNRPLSGRFHLPSLLSQPWDGGTMVIRYWYDGGATVGRYWYDIGMILVRRWYDGVAGAGLPPGCRSTTAKVSAFEAIEPRFVRAAPLSIGGGYEVASAGVAPPSQAV
jgi:hypothetical protein